MAGCRKRVRRRHCRRHQESAIVLRQRDRVLQLEGRNGFLGERAIEAESMGFGTEAAIETSLYPRKLGQDFRNPCVDSAHRAAGKATLLGEACSLEHDAIE